MDFEKHPLYPWLQAMRRDLHLHPELAFEEKRTTAKLKEILSGLGVRLIDLPDMETGTVGLVEGKQAGPTLGLRADIDALPLEEDENRPYRSTKPGLMHACGHDAHTTIMLGVAKNLVESGLNESLQGRVKFIFQPAEERVSGAKAMIEAGVMENPAMDRILACHMWVDLPVGQAGIYRGVSHAASDLFAVTIKGRGTHGARPHQGIDPILAGAHFTTALHSIVSRDLDPADTAVISLGKFQAGTAANIIPDTTLIEGSIRTLRPETRTKVVERLEQLTQSLQQAFRVEASFQLRQGVPVCTNNPEVSDFLHEAAVKVLGEENVFYLEPSTGGEDFAYFTQLIPGSIMRLGCANPDKGIVHPLHSPLFDIDEAVLPMGMEIMTQAVKSYLT